MKARFFTLSVVMSHLALAGIDPEANEYDDAKDSILGEGKHEKETANIFFPC